MTTAGLDFNTNQEIFRHDQVALFAMNRHLASIMGVRLAYSGAASGYAAGTVLARNSVSGLFQSYNNAGASGTDVAVGVLAHPCAPASGGTEAAQCITAGYLYESKLVGLDAAGKTDLQARTITGADGVAVLVF